eukprot:364393-Chlamydomonas_euryale.AAC.4
MLCKLPWYCAALLSVGRQTNSILEADVFTVGPQLVPVAVHSVGRWDQFYLGSKRTTAYSGGTTSHRLVLAVAHHTQLNIVWSRLRAPGCQSNGRHAQGVESVFAWRGGTFWERETGRI